MAKRTDIKVYISRRESKCGECGHDLGRGAWITLHEEKGALCLSCADLDHLVFLPSGDTALSRRARKHSDLSAVVLKWSRTRKRYERKGALVEEAGLARAEEECLADVEVRARRRQREAERRAEIDHRYVEEFARRIRDLFPGCPQRTAHTIAEHACLKYSGRVGRTAAAKALDEKAVRLAVIAHIRHRETPYDRLLSEGMDRLDARLEVAGVVRAVVESWEESAGARGGETRSERAAYDL
ncbi:MAG: DUF2293 domain-containing protein [Acidobacteria bacterium]|nr:DUF2293 domain-containing protein [Acidobacteriota bacterium]